MESSKNILGNKLIHFEEINDEDFFKNIYRLSKSRNRFNNFIPIFDLKVLKKYLNIQFFQKNINEYFTTGEQINEELLKIIKVKLIEESEIFNNNNINYNNYNKPNNKNYIRSFLKSKTMKNINSKIFKYKDKKEKKEEEEILYIIFEGKLEVIYTKIGDNGIGKRVKEIEEKKLYTTGDYFLNKGKEKEIKDMNKIGYKLILAEISYKKYLALIDKYKTIHITNEINFLKKIYIFKDFNKISLQKLVESINKIKVKKNVTIENQGELYCGLYIIRRGQFELIFNHNTKIVNNYDLMSFDIKKSELVDSYIENKNYKLCILTEGEIIGDFELERDSKNWIFTTKCCTDESIVYFISKDKIYKLFNKDVINLIKNFSKNKKKLVQERFDNIRFKENNNNRRNKIFKIMKNKLLNENDILSLPLKKIFQMKPKKVVLFKNLFLNNGSKTQRNFNKRNSLLKKSLSLINNFKNTNINNKVNNEQNKMNISFSSSPLTIRYEKNINKILSKKNYKLGVYDLDYYSIIQKKLKNENKDTKKIIKRNKSSIDFINPNLEQKKYAYFYNNKYAKSFSNNNNISIFNNKKIKAKYFLNKSNKATNILPYN